MSATAYKPRSPNFKSFKVTTPTAGYTAGQMIKISDCVGVLVETTTTAEDAVLIYACEKIVVPKTAGCVFAAGAKVYFDAAEAAVNATASGNTLCGRALVAAVSADTTLEMDLNGAVPA
jgi:predicted RecA/RadA family phage recombinase